MEDTEREKNRLIFEEMPVPEALAQMAVPMVVSQLIVLIYNMADTFYLGRTGNPYMVAGASLILPIFNVCIAFANISGTGGGTLIARLLGAGKEDHAKSVATMSFWFSLVSAALFSALTAVFMHPLINALGASSETFGYARQYIICVIVIGAVPTVLSMTMGNLLRNSGCAKQAGFGVSMGGVINIILDPLFMFVILPKGNEVLGAGIATMLSNFIVCIYFIVIISKLNSSVLNFSPKNGIPEKSEIKSFFAVGIPAAMGPFLFDIDYIILDRLAAGYSDRALAAIGIVLKAERLPLNVGVGLCMGMVPIAAYNYSSGNLKRMSETVKCTRKTGIIISVISIVLYEVFAPYIMRFFISDPQTVEIGSDFLRIRALATVMMFMSFSYVNLFQAVGHGGRALLLVVIRWAVLNIPMLFIMNAILGINGIVWSQFISDTITAGISMIMYLRFKKRLDFGT